MHTNIQHLDKKIHPIYSSNKFPLNHSNHVLENRCFKSLNLDVESSWRRMLEAFHWLSVTAVSMAIPHAPWFPNLLLILSECSVKYYLVWAQKNWVKLSFIWLETVIGIERTMCGLFFTICSHFMSSTFIYAYFLRPLLLINICYKRKIPTGWQLVTIIIIYGEKMPVTQNTVKLGVYA